MPLNADEIVRRLGLQPHPKEEGYFIEVYRSPEQIPGTCLPDRYGGPRCFGTSIYFLLKAGGFSEMHRLKSDEIFHFYLGDPVEILLLYSNGEGEWCRLGNRPDAGETPQIVIPSGTWQGMRTTGAFSLIGCTVSPGFEYSDYESGNREDLLRAYPAWADPIRHLTRGR